MPIQEFLDKQSKGELKMGQEYKVINNRGIITSMISRKGKGKPSKTPTKKANIEKIKKLLRQLKK